MTINCIRCEQPFIRDDSIPFAPRLCEDCLEVNQQAIAAQKASEQGAAQRAVTKAQLEIAQGKIPSPNDCQRFPATWATAKAWAYRRSKPRPFLVIAGPSGSCKTRMAVECLTMDLAAVSGRTFDWWSGMELKASALAAATGEGRSLAAFREQLSRARFLVLDDMVAHSKISESLGALQLSIIDERAARHRSTIFTIQTAKPIQTAEQLVPLIMARYDIALTGEAIARRFYESSEFII